MERLAPGRGALRRFAFGDEEIGYRARGPG